MNCCGAQKDMTKSDSLHRRRNRGGRRPGPLTFCLRGPILPISILYWSVGHTLQDCFHTECSISSKGEVWKAQHWPHHFPSLDFTSSCAECKADTRDTSIVSVGNEQSLCPLMWDTREKWGHLKNASRLHYAHHLQIASDATDRLFRLPRYVYIPYSPHTTWALSRALVRTHLLEHPYFPVRSFIY